MRILELCFLTVCITVNCSCVDANKVTSLTSTTDKNTQLRTSEKSVNCMILNTRIKEANNELEKQNTTHKRGMLCRLYKRAICNRIDVNKHALNES